MFNNNFQNNLIELFAKNRSVYIGKRFRYYSKYGGIVDNLICSDFAVTHRINTYTSKLEYGLEIDVISDKNNIYSLRDVEFYEY